MSDERKVKADKAENDEVKPEDVEAHVKTRNADDDASEPADDDVEAHVKTR